VRGTSDDALERVIAAVNAAKSGNERAAGAAPGRSGTSSGPDG
jgi:hypothetical protein